MKKFAIFTGTRAEYGLMKYLIKALNNNFNFETHLIVSSTHLSSKFGETLKEIKLDGLKPSFYIPVTINSNKGGMCLQTAETIKGLSEVLEQLNPEYLIVLGDRFETFGAATAAHLLGIKIAHIHGGETTLGAIDDKLRHAISQLSTLHFTSAIKHKEKVEKMGHKKEYVFNVGPMAIDGLLNMQKLNREEFQTKTNFFFNTNNFLITYHPETISKDLGIELFKNLLSVLNKINCNILFTSPNADFGHEIILKEIKSYINKNKSSALFIPSLGQELYLNALRLFDCVIGNSSSGIIEAPLVGNPVINIGDRQKGRYRFGKVIDVNNQKGIEDAIQEITNKNSNKIQDNEFLRFEKLNSPTQIILKVFKNI